MTQSSSMGPPQSPRETRRSGRRSAPSVSTSNSKSPDSDHPQRPPLVSSSSGSRSRKLKQEDVEESVPTNSSNTSGSNGRGKRKSKEKPSQPAQDDVPDAVDGDQPAETGDEELEGITRCVCGSTEDDPDAGEFMVQCETCNSWQHGLCMGYESEEQLTSEHYYCELCRPDLHVDLLKKLSKKARQSSATSHHTAAASSRLSRSHSPTLSTLKQPSKRRNTMNSRDAAFDENLKEILESTAAEAGTEPETSISAAGNNPQAVQETEESTEPAPANRKKRKRADNDAPPAKKRTRSMSTSSDHLPVAAAPSVTPREDTPNIQKPPPATANPNPPPPQKPAARNKRGGGRKTAANQEQLLDADGVPVPPTSKRQGNGGRSKNAGGNKRPPQSNAGETVSRRGQASGSSGQAGGSNVAESSRAHRNTHAYMVSQQPLYTSWNLPDYLAHLESLLPTEVPRPLEVVSGIAGRESIERTTERGVKVKWPSKRMSVVDMNKRVRALVEWVGREQASASDRARRREVLEKAVKENALLQKEDEAGPSADRMVVDSIPRTNSPSTIPPAPDDSAAVGGHMSLMKDMEKLMTDLITFQERFGPGAKSRERRHVS